MSTVTRFLVVGSLDGFKGAIYDHPSDAIDNARDQTTADKLPRQIWRMQLLGETEAVRAAYHDYGPQPMPAEGKSESQK